MIDNHKRIAKFWLGLLILEIVLEIVATSLIPVASGYLFGQLSLKSALVWTGIGYVFMTRFGFDLCQAFKQYLQIHFAMARRYLHTIGLGVGINTKAWKDVDNVEQRIQEDIKIYYLNITSTYTEYTISLGILVFLIVAHHDETFLILSALGYAVLSVLIAWLFNPHMKHAERIVQKTEASFRHALIQFQRPDGFHDTLAANKKAATIRLGFSLFTKLQSGLLLIIPYIFLLNPYLEGKIEIGTLVENVGIFALIVVNADILINMFPVLTAGNASKERVQELE